MGVVYHAYDPVVKRDVAIKFLSSLDSEETELISRFEREARLAGGLRHPNIVTIYDLGHYEGRPYIVMEYIVGRDLETVIKEKQPLGFDQKVEIMLQICKGLEAAHQKGIIHRDIKPANIRLQEDNAVKIMDFGIARMGASQLTRSGYIIGTLQYMSPEQISGEQLDPRTDLFSAGIMAYELFTSSNPFSGGGAVDIMYRILNVRPQPIQDLPEEFGSELNQIIIRAIEKNRDLRYQSAKEMAQDLEEVHFYLKTLKFKPKVAGRIPAYADSITQNISMEQVPVARRDPNINPTVAVDMPHAKIPTFGQTIPEKAPRTGVGANYSETGQILIRDHPTSRKFYFLGALFALLFIGGLIYFASRNSTQQSPPMVINTVPPGADVIIHNQKMGVTPYTIPKPTDEAVLLHLDGYKEKTLMVSAATWTESITEKLDLIKTTPVPPPVVEGRTISVTSQPTGAAMWLDGQAVGVTPGDAKIPDSKTHELVLKADGYTELHQNIDSTTADKLNLVMEATAAPGNIRYSGDYPVSLFVNGKASRGNQLSLPAGTYTISVRTKNNAFIRYSKQVEVRSGETTTIQQPAMGILNIKANPSNCKISIDGEFVDDAPIFNLPVQSGKHIILFNWDKLSKKLSKDVQVEADQTDTIMGVPND